MMITTKNLIKTNHQIADEQTYDAILDRYRDNNWLPVYKCPVCQMRGLGTSVTFHFTTGCIGTMLRENKERN